MVDDSDSEGDEANFAKQAAEASDSFDDDFEDEEGEEEDALQGEDDFDVEAYLKWRQENPDGGEFKPADDKKQAPKEDSDSYGEEEG